MRSVKFLVASLVLSGGWGAGFFGGLVGPAFAGDPPPREIEVAEVPWEKLSDQEVGPYGTRALQHDPDKWRHAETPNYILHFRRVTEARKVARELEFSLWFVAEALGFKGARSEKKGHAYIFKDTEEWEAFIATTDLPTWAGSIAIGDELFLDVRNQTGDRRFNSGTLAHEATHAAIARLYGRRKWPLWLNEGFAEYVGAAGVAARRNQSVGRHQTDLPLATMKIEEIVKVVDAYPKDEEELGAFYQSSDRLVRFLMQQFPGENFPKLVDQILDGTPLYAAVIAVSEAKIPDEETFRKAYAKFKP